MSYDRKIDWVCPHQVVEEALFVNVDRVTIRPLRPIASVNALKVRLASEVFVPSNGLTVAAEALAGKLGPFNIRLGVNDTLTLKVDADPEQVRQIPPGENLTSRDVAARLATIFSGVRFDVTEKGRLRMRSLGQGKDATMLFRPSALATTLGFSTNRQWSGRTTFPGWSLVADTQTYLARPTRLIIFDTPLPGFREYVELTYTTIREECRRCGGIGIENDWRYGVTGDVAEVRNEALLLQEIQKIVYTLQKSNSFHEWYGTNILNAIGKKQTSSGIVQSFIVSDIREAFQRWQNVKKQQEEDVGQAVSDEEYPFRLLEVKLTPDQLDPTTVYVKVTVQNRSQRPIDIERGVKLPLPLDILGSTVQDGLIRESLSRFALTR